MTAGSLGMQVMAVRSTTSAQLVYASEIEFEFLGKATQSIVPIWPPNSEAVRWPPAVYEYKGHMPPKNGWAVSRERMEEMDKQGRLFIPSDPRRRIQRKRYLDELQGDTVDNLWDDISPVNSQAKERIGYPTQKPQALLERIINASSHEGDVILDPFCGVCLADKGRNQFEELFLRRGDPLIPPCF